MLLTLPRLSPAVPTRYVFGGMSERLIRVAQAMCSTGMLVPSDLPQTKGAFHARHVRDAVEAAWQRVVGRRFHFRTLSLGAVLVLVGDGQHYHELESEEDGKLIEVSFNASWPETIFIGKAMQALEDAATGLGRYAVMVIDKALSRFGVPMTPMGALHMAGDMYWMGERDEKETLALYAEDGEPTDDLPTRASLFAGVPVWAYDFWEKSLPCLTSIEAADAVEMLGGGMLATLARRIEELDALLGAAEDGFPDGSEDGYEGLEYPAMVRWSEDDALHRIYDDFYQYQSQGEIYHCIGHVRFAPKPEELNRALDRLDRTLSVYEVLDTVFDMIRSHDAV